MDWELEIVAALLGIEGVTRAVDNGGGEFTVTVEGGDTYLVTVAKQ